MAHHKKMPRLEFPSMFQGTHTCYWLGNLLLSWVAEAWYSRKEEGEKGSTPITGAIFVLSALALDCSANVCLCVHSLLPSGLLW